MGFEDELSPDGACKAAVLYIQMQLCELTLRDYLLEPGRDASLDGNKPYFLQLLQGLQHIHNNSLIHRDLTPANVFITNDRQTIKIGDFGLSREMTSDLPNLASTANLASTSSITSSVTTPAAEASSPGAITAASRSSTIAAPAIAGAITTTATIATAASVTTGTSCPSPSSATLFSQTIATTAR